MRLKTIRSLPAATRFCRAAAHPLVLVPTMGALHAGHAALIARARRLAGPRGTVLVSIYVNPTQFGPAEDFSRYPRPFAADRALCIAHGADAIFHPPQMFTADHSTWVNEELVSLPLCGAARPGHFRGVCTVVLKLFTVTQPDSAVFGRKDYQQCMVLRRMVRDLNLPVRIVPVDEVTHLQAQDKYVSLYTADGEQLIRISLKELTDQLDPNMFVQVHRSTIVNMRAVATAERDFTGRVMLTLKGVKEKVQVSRQYAHLFARM